MDEVVEEVANFARQVLFEYVLMIKLQEPQKQALKLFRDYMKDLPNRIDLPQEKFEVEQIFGDFAFFWENPSIERTESFIKHVKKMKT
jgi:hypothetical protein